MNCWRNAMLLAGVAATTLFASAGGLREDEVVFSARLLSRRCDTRVDLRTVIPVMRASDRALTGIGYSARGWRIDLPVDDQTRMAEITAVPGTLVGTSFTPDGSEEQILLQRQGEGTWNWAPEGTPEQKVYQLKHVARTSGGIDAEATYFGYLDFSTYNVIASLKQVEKAVFVPLLDQPIITTQDAGHPWQPIALGVAGIGIETDGELIGGTQTITSFAFQGKGTFICEYQLSGGSLTVTVDGVAQTFSAATDWQSLSFPIEVVGVHEVSFAYTSAGDGGKAALRNVCWAVPANISWISRRQTDLRVDLREGPVRSPARMEHVLPFAYSSTNWIGDVQGTVAKVTIAELTGTGDDVRTWTEKGATRVLHDASGEGAVKWHPKKGVWKATFDILGTSHSEEVWFDLRNAIAPGFLLMVF